MTRALIYVSAMGLACACSDSTQTGAADGGHGAPESGGASGAADTGGASGAAGSGGTFGGAANGGRSGSSAGGGTSGGAASGGKSGSSANGGASGRVQAGGASGAASGAGGTPSTTEDGGSPGGSPACSEIQGLAEAYKAAHPGNGGKDWDINAKTPAEIAADPDAQRLLSICGKDERPVIPLLAWEYGGGDHSWINPQASAVAYCVPIPVHPDSSHWQYDMTMDHVTADIYVKCPDLNPCKAKTGADQVMACLGDMTNIEILVDTASLNDGADAGLALANASTDLYLITSDGMRVHMYTGL